MDKQIPYGFWVYVANQKPTFIQNESQIDLVNDALLNGSISEEQFYEMVAFCKQSGGPVMFTDVRASIEPVFHVAHAPRFIILTALVRGRAFYTAFNPEERENVCKTVDGQTAYAVLGFADTTGEAQAKMFGAKYPEFAHSVRVGALVHARLVGSHEEESE